MKILAAPIVFNEEKKISKVIERFKKCDNLRDVDFLIMDDGSTDNSKQIAEKHGVKSLSHSRRCGVGAAIRTVIHYAQDNNYDILVILAGNDKDRPEEIYRLIAPILKDNYDFVQGSRFLPGGVIGNAPNYRTLATKLIHPFIFSIFTGKRMTDSTNGFRAIRLSIFKDKRIDITQRWLDKYELEPYIFYKTVILGYKVKEVPVTKIYPPKKLGYTKMRPIIDWWGILKPLFCLKLGIKR